jgi:fatty acid desaturase
MAMHVDALTDHLRELAPEPAGPLGRDDLIELSRLRPWKTLLDVTIVWALVAAVLETVLRVRSVWVGPLAFLAIGILQNALVLWTHEASHYGFSRHKVQNDVLADLFVSGPTGATVAQYRWQHFKHHRFLGNPSKEIDLSAWMCIRRWRLPWTIVRHASGWYGWQVVNRYRRNRRDASAGPPPRSAASLAGLAVGNGLLLGLCALQGSLISYFVFWVGPLFTVTLLIGNLRTIVEHQASSDVCDAGLVPMPPVTRWVAYNFLERWLIAPVGFSYHFEHHLYPSVPYSRLRDLRRQIERTPWFHGAEVVRSDGYFKTLWRLSCVPGFGARLPIPSTNEPTPPNTP